MVNTPEKLNPKQALDEINLFVHGKLPPEQALAAATVLVEDPDFHPITKPKTADYLSLLGRYLPIQEVALERTNAAITTLTARTATAEDIARIELEQKVAAHLYLQTVPDLVDQIVKVSGLLNSYSTPDKTNDEILFDKEEILSHFTLLPRPLPISEALAVFEKELPPDIDSGIAKVFREHPLATYQEKLKDIQNLKIVAFIAAGKDEVALLLDDGNVLKIAKPIDENDDLDPAHEDRPDFGTRFFDLPILQQSKIGVEGNKTLHWYIQPYVHILDYSKTETAQHFAKELFDLGYDLQDRRPYQLGRDKTGRLWVVDYEAVHSIKNIDQVRQAQLTLEEYDFTKNKHPDWIIRAHGEKEKRDAVAIYQKIGEEKFRAYYGDKVLEATKKLIEPAQQPTQVPTEATSSSRLSFFEQSQIETRFIVECLKSKQLDTHEGSEFVKKLIDLKKSLDPILWKDLADSLTNVWEGDSKSAERGINRNRFNGPPLPEVLAKIEADATQTRTETPPTKEEQQQHTPAINQAAQELARQKNIPYEEALAILQRGEF